MEAPRFAIGQLGAFEADCVFLQHFLDATEILVANTVKPVLFHMLTFFSYAQAPLSKLYPGYEKVLGAKPASFDAPFNLVTACMK